MKQHYDKLVKLYNQSTGEERKKHHQVLNDLEWERFTRSIAKSQYWHLKDYTPEFGYDIKEG